MMQRMPPVTEQDDHELLRAYARSQSQAAFAQLVARHVDLVYSVARRRVADAHLAEDVTQAVFLTLAAKARAIGRDVVVSGWLFSTARLVSNNAIRQRQRRERHERPFASGQGFVDAPAVPATPDWESLAPHLERAMDQLARGERDAVLLRFYRGMTFKEVAAAIGISEDAASQRVSRGVAKLRSYFARRGINTTGDALTSVVAAHAVAAAPAALAAVLAPGGSAAATAAGAAAANTLAQGAVQAMAIANIKIAAAVTAAVLVTGTAGVVTYNTINAAPARPAAAATTTATRAGAPAASPALTAALQKKIPEFNVDAVGLNDCVDFLRDVTGANIHVDWASLATAKVNPATPCTLNQRDIALAGVLELLLQNAGQGKLSYLATGDVIWIMAKDAQPAREARLAAYAARQYEGEVARAMQRVVPEVRMDGVGLTDTVDFLRDVTGTNIFVEWNLLESAGVKRTSPVTLRVAELPMRDVLAVVVESVPSRHPLDFTAEKDVITITFAK